MTTVWLPERGKRVTLATSVEAHAFAEKFGGVLEEEDVD